MILFADLTTFQIKLDSVALPPFCSLKLKDNYHFILFEKPPVIAPMSVLLNNHGSKIEVLITGLLITIIYSEIVL